MRKLLLMAVLLFPLVSTAQTVRYISDELEIPLRAGAGTRFKIVKMLPSGAEVELLRNNTEDGYSLVRVDNVQGWLLSRYLMEAPSARASLAAAQAAVTPLQSTNQSLQQTITQLRSTQKDSEARQAQLTADNQRLSQELAQIRKAAANTIAIDNQNRELQERVVQLESQLQLIQQENQSLADATQQMRFLTGAGVLFGGIILGLVLPRLRTTKRTRWGDL